MVEQAIEVLYHSGEIAYLHAGTQRAFFRNCS